MTRLDVVQHFHLTPYTRRMLSQHQIETVADLLTANDRTLGSATNLCATSLDELRQYLIHVYGPQTSDGLSYKESAMHRTFLLQTGIEKYVHAHLRN